LRRSDKPGPHLATTARPGHAGGTTCGDRLLCLCAAVRSLDWISLVQVLPGVGFTLWNPPPAASLVLLLLEGLRFAPALFIAGVISDGLVGGCPLGIQSMIVSELMVAAGYTGVAAVLRRLTRADRGFPRVADVAWLLLVVGAGTAASLGVRRQSLADAGVYRWLGGISVRSRNQACHCRSRSEPGAGD